HSKTGTQNIYRCPVAPWFYVPSFTPVSVIRVITATGLDDEGTLAVARLGIVQQGRILGVDIQNGDAGTHTEGESKGIYVREFLDETDRYLWADLVPIPDAGFLVR